MNFEGLVKNAQLQGAPQASNHMETVIASDQRGNLYVFASNTEIATAFGLAMTTIGRIASLWATQQMGVFHQSQ